MLPLDTWVDITHPISDQEKLFFVLGDEDTKFTLNRKNLGPMTLYMLDGEGRVLDQEVTRIYGYFASGVVRDWADGKLYAWGFVADTFQFRPTPQNPNPEVDGLLNRHLYAWEISVREDSFTLGDPIDLGFGPGGPWQDQNNPVESAQRRALRTRVFIYDGVWYSQYRNQGQDPTGAVTVQHNPLNKATLDFGPDRQPIGYTGRNVYEGLRGGAVGAQVTVAVLDRVADSIHIDYPLGNLDILQFAVDDAGNPANGGPANVALFDFMVMTRPAGTTQFQLYRIDQSDGGGLDTDLITTIPVQGAAGEDERLTPHPRQAPIQVPEFVVQRRTDHFALRYETTIRIEDIQVEGEQVVLDGNRSVVSVNPKQIVAYGILKNPPTSLLRFGELEFQFGSTTYKLRDMSRSQDDVDLWEVSLIVGMA